MEDRTVLHTGDISIASFRHTGPGWQGLPPAVDTQTLVEDMIKEKKMGPHLGSEFIGCFYNLQRWVPPPFFFLSTRAHRRHDSPVPLLIMTKAGHLLAVRLTIAANLVELHGEFAKCLTKTLGKDFSRSSFQEDFKGGIRGDHAAVIFGIWRQSAAVRALFFFVKDINYTDARVYYRDPH